MEENEFLQDLLECSVCLCTLSEQSKVLPCQHTFCTSCISEILNSQNELKCPECRIPVKITSLDELPSNILLIRLLEGLKQNMRVKNNNRLIKTPNQTPMKQMGNKLTILQTPTSSNQKQLATNIKNRNIKASNLQKLHNTYDNGRTSSLQMPWQKHDNQQQFIFNNCQQMIYGTNNNLPTSTNYHQNQIANQRRQPAQLNLDNTLVKQPLTDIPTLPSNNLILNNQQSQANNKTIANTPTTSSIINPNLNNTSPFVLNNQLINKPIMMNARALRDSDQVGNWSIKKNDILFIKEQLNAYWYLAIFNGIQGIVPISFVELIPNNLLKQNTTHSAYSTLPSPNSVVYQPIINNQATTSSQFQSNSLQLIDDIQLPLPQQYFQHFTLCRALYDFRITDVNDKNCLNFKKNDLITLIRRVDDNWLEGSLNNNIGIFPITFVEFLPTVRPATRSSSQSSNNSNFNSNQTAIKQAACLSKPPIYQHNRTQSTTPNNGPLISNRNAINISHSRSNSINHQNSTALPTVNSVPEITHTRSNSISIINSQQQQQQNMLNNIPHHYNNNLNNDFNNTNPFSFDNLEEQSNSNLINLSSSSSNSYDNLLDVKSSSNQNKANQNLYIALYNYNPQKKDELALKKNELYFVLEKHGDGWYLAKSLKDDNSGVVPGNYLILKNNHQSHQAMIANRRSFGNLSNKFDSADNLLNNTKPKQLLTTSIDNNLSDLNNTMTKMNLNTNAKSENYLSNQKNEQQQNIISKSVEQLNNNNSNFDGLIGLTNLKKSDSNNSSTNSSPQWPQPKIKALTRSINKNEQNITQLNNNKQTSQESSYSLDLSGELRIEISTNGNNTAHVIKEVINTPIKKEDKKVNLIKMFTGKRNKVDKQKNAFSFDNKTFSFDISPKN